VYGADAVGGVVNFNLRRDFEGALTQARFGGAAGDALDQREIGQLFGKRWDRVHLVLGVDLRSSSALESSSRRKAHSDHTSFGGTNFDTTLSNPGNVLTPTGMLAIPPDQDGSSLAFSDLIPGQLNLTDRFAHTDIISAQRMGSAYGALHFTPRDNFSISVDAYASQRRARAASGSFARALMVPFSNPFARQIATPIAPALVFYDFFDDLGQRTLRATVRTDFFTGSFEYRFSNDWYIGGYARRATERQHQSVDNLVNRDELTIALASDDPAMALNPFGDGSFTSLQTLDRIRTEGHTFARSRTSSLGLDASGPLPKLLGRDVRFGIALDYRDQALRSEVRSGGAGADGRFSRSRDAFALLTQLDLAAAERIDLSFSARYETFPGAGDALTSRIEARWRPIDSVTLFANGSDSFRLPPLGQLDEGQNGSVVQGLPDPQSPTGLAIALVEFGKNARLQPETAQGWSAGVRIDPPLAGVRMRLSYFDARIRNRIESTAFTDGLLQDLELEHLVTRSPSPQQQDDVCSRTLFTRIPGGPDCRSPAVDTLLDLRLRNIAVLESRGIELNATWSLKTTPGTLSVEVNAARIIDYEQAQTPSAAFVERVDTEHQPLDFRLVGTVTWLQGRFAALATVNFADRYHDRQTDPGRLVSAWTTYDASLGYSFGDELNARLIATNLFNQSPPFLDNAFAVIGYDPENADLKGRQLSLGISKRW
jgi:iron complex outermembrane recepter protein